MIRDLDIGPRFEIDQTAGEVVMAHNTLIDAKQRGGEEQARAIEQLADLLANKPGAIEVISAMQER